MYEGAGAFCASFISGECSLSVLVVVCVVSSVNTMRWLSEEGCRDIEAKGGCTESMEGLLSKDGCLDFMSREG